MDKRWHRVQWGQERKRTADATWKQPLIWERQAAAFYAQHGRRRRVFCASLADVFDNAVPADWRRDLFSLIELTPHLTWLLLTKRIGNAPKLIAEARSHDWLMNQSNVWLGMTVVNQTEFERDSPKLWAVPTKRRWLSAEPLLGPLDISARLTHYAGLGWVVVGGESGSVHRQMRPEWPRNIAKQCAEARVPFFFKQWGGARGNGGAVLDGREIQQWPPVSEM